MVTGDGVKGAFFERGVDDFTSPDNEVSNINIRVFEDNKGANVLAKILPARLTVCTPMSVIAFYVI